MITTNLKNVIGDLGHMRVTQLYQFGDVTCHLYTLCMQEFPLAQVKMSLLFKK